MKFFLRQEYKKLGEPEKQQLCNMTEKLFLKYYQRELKMFGNTSISLNFWADHVLKHNERLLVAC